MSDKELGLKVFKAFWNWNRTFHSSFKLSFDEFLKSYGNKANIYLDGIGGGVREAGMSDSRIETAMRSMAVGSGGKIPANPLKMISYLSNEAVKIDWLDATGFVAAETAKDVLKGAESIGNSIITTGKILNFLLPAIALIFVYFWINKKTEGTLGRAVKSLRR